MRYIRPRKTLSLSSKEEMIMLTMLHQARYGIEIIEMVWEASDGSIEINFGSLYPALNKLIKRGLIVETQDLHPEENLAERGGHRRKYHMLTEQGREALNQVYKFRSILRDMKGRWQAYT